MENYLMDNGLDTGEETISKLQEKEFIKWMFRKVKNFKNLSEPK